VLPLRAGSLQPGRALPNHRVLSERPRPGNEQLDVESFAYPDDIPYDRGKVLSAEQLGSLERFSRYLDVDGDGIPYRTLPGTNHAAAPYFTRGSGHNESAEYSERPATTPP